MYGIIFDEFEKYAAHEAGAGVLATIRGLTGRGDHAYQLDASYPDAEIGVMVGGLAEATGRSAEQVVGDFGQAMVPGLLEVYGFLVNPRWSFIDFLLNTEGVIHRGVKLHTPNAKPPELQIERAGSQSVLITYRSRRALCPLAKGIVRGAAAHYKVDITITEARCMLRGDPECLITVSEGEV